MLAATRLAGVSASPFAGDAARIPTPPKSAQKGVFCHVTFELCPGETMITQGIDSGHGDYYRLSNVPGDEWCDFEGPITVDGNADYKFDGMYACGEARSYSPVTPLNEESVQLIIKQARSDAEENGCTAGKRPEWNLPVS